MVDQLLVEVPVLDPMAVLHNILLDVCSWSAPKFWSPLKTRHIFVLDCFDHQGFFQISDIMKIYKGTEAQWYLRLRGIQQPGQQFSVNLLSG